MGNGQRPEVSQRLKSSVRGTRRIDIVIVFPEHNDETIRPLINSIHTLTNPFFYSSQDVINTVILHGTIPQTGRHLS